MKQAVSDISAIITCGDEYRETLACVRSLMRYGPALREIFIVSRGASTRSVHALQSFVNTRDSVQLIQYPAHFSESKVKNLAAAKARGEQLFFMSVSTRLHPGSHGLLQYMSQRAAQSDVGAVGCLLLAKDKKTIRHAGVFKLPGKPFHILYSGFKVSKAIRLLGSRTFPYSIRHSRAVLAVSGPMLVRRSVFKSHAGFDEKHNLSAIAGNTELCLRLNRAKKQTWFCAGGSLLDYAPASQPSFDLPLRLSILNAESDSDPLLPKLSVANLRTPQQKQPLFKSLKKLFKR